jgi:PAS domain S-box-containing protein
MVKANQIKDFWDKKKVELLDELEELRRRVDDSRKLEQECIKAYDRLQGSEEKFRAIFEQAADAIVIFDAGTGEFLEFNDMAHSNLGYTRKEFKKLKIADFEVIESPDEVAKHTSKVVNEGFDTFESKHRRKDGDIRDVFVSCRAINLNGKKCIQSMWRDITERKRAALALEESEMRYKLMAEAIPDAVVTTDMDGKITHASLQALKLHGFDTVDELLGKSAFDYINPIEHKKLRRVFQDVGKNEIVRIKEFACLRRDGSRFPAELSCARIESESGMFNGYIAITRDITERKKAEEKIKRNQEMLLDSQEEIKKFSHKILTIREKEKKNLVTILHHEIGSLALALSSGIAAIEDKIKNNEMNSALEINKKSKSVLNDFVSTIKDLTLDLRPPNLEIIGLSEVLREYLERSAEMGKIDIDFQANIDDSKINDDMAIVIFRIVQEAINNILKHAHATFAKVVITTKKKKLLLKIYDNGRGKARISSSKGSRMKLGLRLIQEMMESLDGNFYIKSKEGQGTEISVIIPLKEKGNS